MSTTTQRTHARTSVPGRLALIIGAMALIAACNDGPLTAPTAVGDIPTGAVQLPPQAMIAPFAEAPDSATLKVTAPPRSRPLAVRPSASPGSS